jgi:hypothetical protein
LGWALCDGGYVVIKYDTEYSSEQGRFYITGLSDDQILWNHYNKRHIIDALVHRDGNVVWFTNTSCGINLLGVFNYEY